MIVIILNFFYLVLVVWEESIIDKVYLKIRFWRNRWLFNFVLNKICLFVDVVNIVNSIKNKNICLNLIELLYMVYEC